MTEKDYLKMIAEGDKEAFRVIFDKYYPKVLAFLQSFLQSYDDAEDVAQSVFVRLWFVRHTLVDVTRISAYLFRMTTNMAIIDPSPGRRIWILPTGIFRISR